MTDRKIEEYVLVFECNSKELEERVNGLIAEGFRPHGNARLVISDHPKYLFTQTMVLYAVEEND